MKDDEIENNFQFEIIFQKKKNTIKRWRTKHKGKRNRSVAMIFLRDSAQIKVWEREKKEKKKIKLALNHTESPCTCCLWRKRTSRRIKWGVRTMISAIWVSHMCCSKLAERLMRWCVQTHFFPFFFIYQNTTLSLNQLIITRKLL